MGHEIRVRFSLQSSPDRAHVHREPSTEHYRVQEQPLDEGGPGARPFCRLAPI